MPDANDDVPLLFNGNRKLSMPFALLVSLISGIAVGYAAWSNVQLRITEQGAAIRVLEVETRATREILIRIDENVKDLRRGTRYNTRSDTNNP